MRIFLICPVRNADEKTKEFIKQYIEKLERQGHQVYYPARDTNQNDLVGDKICKANMRAIKNAHEVHWVWDGQSTGSLFDFGVATALGKKVVPVEGYFPPPTPTKSFQNVARAMYQERKKQKALWDVVTAGAGGLLTGILGAFLFKKFWPKK